MDRLKGKIAIVTGASRGIGAAIAQRFAAEGACVAMGARTGEKLLAVAAEIEAAGGAALPMVTDVSKPDDIRALVAACVERFGAVDILVNNAAVTTFNKPIASEEMEAEYDRLMATNVKSAWMAAHYAVPHMRARGGGSIIQVSSVHGVASGGCMSAYAASKGALIAGTRALGIELGPDRIRVNCISPGRIWLERESTWLRDRLGPELYAEFQERFPDRQAFMRRNQQALPFGGEPDDVAWCAVYLASDEARFVTGANFMVDGGMTAQLCDPGFLPEGMAEFALSRREVGQWFKEARERSGG